MSRRNSAFDDTEEGTRMNRVNRVGLILVGIGLGVALGRSGFFGATGGILALIVGMWMDFWQPK